MLPIIITGGPCAGKTSVLQYLSAHLPEHGVTPVLVPEAATTLIQGGISPATVGVIAFQDAVFALHLANEAVFGEGSTHLEDKRPLLVFDRGLMDGKAYLRPADFQRMIDSHNLTEDDIVCRYGLILHLESAAVGKPDLQVQVGVLRVGQMDLRIGFIIGEGIGDAGVVPVGGPPCSLVFHSAVFHHHP